MNDNFNNERYIKISKGSGCFLDKYHVDRENEEDYIIVHSETNKKSGNIKFKLTKN